MEYTLNLCVCNSHSSFIGRFAQLVYISEIVAGIGGSFTDTMYSYQGTFSNYILEVFLDKEDPQHSPYAKKSIIDSFTLLHQLKSFPVENVDLKMLTCVHEYLIFYCIEFKAN